MSWLKKRLSEPSTYAAMSGAAASGAVVLQQMGDTLAATGSLKAAGVSVVFALLGMFMREKGGSNVQGPR